MQLRSEAQHPDVSSQTLLPKEIAVSLSLLEEADFHDHLSHKVEHKVKIGNWQAPLPVVNS